MKQFALFCLLCILSTQINLSVGLSDSVCFCDKDKPFFFGVATAAYQIEGAWNVSGKGESIWDRYTHTHPERVFDHSNGDVATDSYHKIAEDVRIVNQLGVSFYRFSLSWSRILPTGLSNEINEDGIRYYRELIDQLHQNSHATPLVTMYHWDLPQPLQDLGGWTNPIMADYFVDYARVVFKAFGDKVKTWLTFNEPLTFCLEGYGGDDAPGARSSGLEAYMCAHNVLRAHGMTYRMAKQEFNMEHGISIVLDFPWMEPKTTSRQDQVAAETARQFLFGWYANPIFSREGDYPAVMRKRIDDISRRQNFPRSRLPIFTKDEIEMIRGSADFLGLNHYTTYLVTPGDGKVKLQPSFYDDAGIVMSQNAGWPKSNSTWLRIVPWGLRKTLNWIKRTYNNPLTIITENGVSTEPGLSDNKRIQYIEVYLRSLHDALKKDDCNVLGYTHWSLMDNFEWMRGYSERFGLFEVDYSSPNKTRTPRKSAKFYERIARTCCLPDTSTDF